MLLKLLGNQITRVIRLIIKIIRQFITESIHSWISRGFPVGRWLASVSMLSPLTGRRIELMCVLSRFISAARPPRHCFYSHDALWCVQLFNLHNIHTCTRTCTDENQSMVTPHTQGWGFENSLSFLHYSLSFTCPCFQWTHCFVTCTRINQHIFFSELLLWEQASVYQSLCHSFIFHSPSSISWAAGWDKFISQRTHLLLCVFLPTH